MIKEHTPLSKRNLCQIDDDLFLRMWELIENVLKNRCGLSRYEVSNFSKPGFECRHNCNIWKGGKFLGFGPSACYFDGGSRWTNPSNFEQWCAGKGPSEDFLDSADRAVEIFLTGLRTMNGWSQVEFKSVTGYDYFELRKNEINQCVEMELISIDKNTLKLSTKGVLLLDYIEREIF